MTPDESLEGLLDRLCGDNHDPAMRRFARACVEAGERRALWPREELSDAFHERAQQCPWIATARSAVRHGQPERAVFLAVMLQLSQALESRGKALLSFMQRYQPTLIARDADGAIIPDVSPDEDYWNKVANP